MIKYILLFLVAVVFYVFIIYSKYYNDYGMKGACYGDTTIDSFSSSLDEMKNDLGKHNYFDAIVFSQNNKVNYLTAVKFSGNTVIRAHLEFVIVNNPDTDGKKYKLKATAMTSVGYKNRWIGPIGKSLDHKGERIAAELLVQLMNNSFKGGERPFEPVWSRKFNQTTSTIDGFAKP